jgi:hypothetical protein
MIQNTVELLYPGICLSPSLIIVQHKHWQVFSEWAVVQEKMWHQLNYRPEPKNSKQNNSVHCRVTLSWVLHFMLLWSEVCKYAQLFLYIHTCPMVIMALQVNGGSCGSKVFKIACNIDSDKISGFRDASDSSALQWWCCSIWSLLYYINFWKFT